TAGDFTVSASVGKSVMNGVALGTGLTINGYTGNTPQTGDAFALIGTAGVGLTNLGDTRIAKLDATVSSRMASYAQPTGFLAATFPSAVGDATAANQSTINTNVLSRVATAALPANFSELAIDGSGDVTYNNAAPPTGASIADTILGRNVAGGASGGRTVKQALYVLRNKVDAGAGNVYQVDDTTIEWSFVATTTPGNPITVVDPT